jgi:hypothetical protein
MDLLNYIFHLGVLFAIYGFLWGIIEIGLRLLSGTRKRGLGEVYIVKAVKYLFLANVTFLFCVNPVISKMTVVNQGIVAGVVLLTYFIGKFQRKKNQSRIFKMGINGFPSISPVFDMKAEVIVIGLSLAAFVAFWFFPTYAINPLANWFHLSIIDIADTPVFGFIFKVIGFFFMLSMIVKVANGIGFLVSKLDKSKPNIYDNSNNDEFDDYEEIN